MFGKNEKGAFSEGVKVFEVVELVGSFGEGEEVGVEGPDFGDLVFGSHGVPPEVPVDEGEGVGRFFGFCPNELVLDATDKEEGENGEGEIEFRPFGLLPSSGEKSGNKEN